MIIKGIENFPESCAGAVVALGNFDGVHIGHQELIKTAILEAKEKGVKCGVITFDPHPVEFFDKSGNFKTLMSTQEKAEVLLSFGLDFVLILSFDSALSSLVANDFVEKVLVEKLKVSHVLTGYNFSFGSKKSGNSQTLHNYSKAGSFGYTQIRQVMHDGLEVSSTYLKDLLIRGRVMLYKELCGRHFYVSGIVSKGQGRAKEALGMATANIPITRDRTLPKLGVYLVSVEVEGIDGKFWGVSSIGTRPTVEDTENVTFEVHIFDFKHDIYGKKLKAEFISFTRPERKYKSMEELKYAVHVDARNAHYMVKNIDKVLASVGG